MRLAGALSLLLLAPVAAQEPGVARALATALEQARGRDQLGRILGEHRFTLTRSQFTPEGQPSGAPLVLAMVYRVSLAEGRLGVVVDVRQPGAERGVELRYEVDVASGRLRGLDSSFPNGEQVSARLEGETLKVIHRHTGAEPSQQEERVDPELLCPKQVGAFLLPALHDLGAPARVAFRDLDPWGKVGPRATLRRAFATPSELIYCTDEGGPLPATTLRVALRGPRANRLVAFETISEWIKTPGGGDRVVHLARSVRLDPEEERR